MSLTCSRGINCLRSPSLLPKPQKGAVGKLLFLPTGDGLGIERLVGYMTRCPFSLWRLIKVSKTGQVIYKSEKDACRAFPDPRAADLASVAKRNVQILSPLDFLAEFTQHTWPKDTLLIR
jgi:hypothetical protein